MRSLTAGTASMSYELEALTDATPRDDLPDFGSGDTVRVHAKAVEGNKRMRRMPLETGGLRSPVH